jgi:hypothetical protein
VVPTWFDRTTILSTLWPSGIGMGSVTSPLPVPIGPEPIVVVPTSHCQVIVLTPNTACARTVTVLPLVETS